MDLARTSWPNRFSSSTFLASQARSKSVRVLRPWTISPLTCRSVLFTLTPKEVSAVAISSGDRAVTLSSASWRARPSASRMLGSCDSSRLTWARSLNTSWASSVLLYPR
jgi:hypothetical protein